jgi:ABC-type antimicrobial peptide transport system permease subunit
MSVFQLYLRLGIDHIADIQSYDHILFVVSLCIIYPIKQWKKLLILITAFTIGHTSTLVLATLQIVKIPTDIIEFLIPVTIFMTALGNVLQKSDKFSAVSHRYKYALAMFFGLIHGLGFSNYLRSMLSKEEGLFLPLLSFNIGIELGQILIVLIIIGLTIFAVDMLGTKRREWNLIFSGASMGIALTMAIERFPW